MYAQIEKPKQNKSRAVANSVGKKKSNGKQRFSSVDHRLESDLQSKFQYIETKDATQEPKLHINRFNSSKRNIQRRNISVLQRVAGGTKFAGIEGLKIKDTIEALFKRKLGLS